MNMKTNLAEKEIANVLKVLGSPFRVKVLYTIGSGEACVCHLENILKKRQAYISQHLMVMRDVGILTSRREGKYIYYSVADKNIFKMLESVAVLKNVSIEKMPKITDGVQQDNCPCPKCED